MSGGLARRSPDVALADLACALTRLDAWGDLMATDALKDCIALLAASHAGVPQ